MTDLDLNELRVKLTDNIKAIYDVVGYEYSKDEELRLGLREHYHAIIIGLGRYKFGVPLSFLDTFVKEIAEAVDKCDFKYIKDNMNPFNKEPDFIFQPEVEVVELKYVPEEENFLNEAYDKIDDHVEGLNKSVANLIEAIARIVNKSQKELTDDPNFVSDKDVYLSFNMTEKKEMEFEFMVCLDEQPHIDSNNHSWMISRTPVDNDTGVKYFRDHYFEVLEKTKYVQNFINNLFKLKSVKRSPILMEYARNKVYEEIVIEVMNQNISYLRFGSGECVDIRPRYEYKPVVQSASETNKKEVKQTKEIKDRNLLSNPKVQKELETQKAIDSIIEDAKAREIYLDGEGKERLPLTYSNMKVNDLLDEEIMVIWDMFDQIPVPEGATHNAIEIDSYRVFGVNEHNHKVGNGDSRIAERVFSNYSKGFEESINYRLQNTASINILSVF